MRAGWAAIAVVLGCVGCEATPPAADTGRPPAADTGRSPTEDSGSPVDQDANAPFDAGMLDCPLGELRCGGACVPVGEDESNCGACGAACAADETCLLGACQPATCPAGTTRCDGACVDVMTDALHCGACGEPCEAGQGCSGGACVERCAGTVCGRGDFATCVDTETDSDHCGMCGRACEGGGVCVAGECACGRTRTLCGSNCVDITSNPDHCGACDDPCPVGASCVGGACDCPDGLTLCDDRCVNLLTDGANCMTCGNACARGQSCNAGVCGGACPVGQTRCGASCVSVATDTTNCGVCGNICGRGTSCAGGLCVPPNDMRADATTLEVGTSEVTVTGNTYNATFDGPAVTCGCSSGRNVWYRFHLPVQAVVYFDTHGAPGTAGETTDTELHLTNEDGSLVTSDFPFGLFPGACNDNAACADAGWFAGASMTATELEPGNYYLAVGSCNPGYFTLHMQMLPPAVATSFSRMGFPAEVTGDLPLGDRSSPMCSATMSGENAHWFTSCGGREVVLSLCRSDGGFYERNDNLLGPFRDPVLSLYSSATGETVACNDDGAEGPGIDCRAQELIFNPVIGLPHFIVGGHRQGSRIRTTLPRGLLAAIVDERDSLGGLDYRMVFRAP